MSNSEGTAAPSDAEQMQRLLQVAIDAWPQFDTDEPVNGGDLVDWFGEWRQQVKEALDLACPPTSPAPHN